MPLAVTVLAAPDDDGLSAADRNDELLTELGIAGLVEQLPDGRLRVTLYLSPPAADDDSARVDVAQRLLDRIEEPLGVRWLDAEPQLLTVREIAERTGRSREAVRLWANGTRGPGGFPAPAGAAGRTALYDWAEVSAWLPAVGIDPRELPLNRHAAAALTARLAGRP
uniref:helix-turn-helix transcriptional regulator n=1 Tax=Amycolatopsis sp. CA-096443 TaxID=3239919 RepID=UPI003F492B77